MQVGRLLVARGRSAIRLRFGSSTRRERESFKSSQRDTWIASEGEGRLDMYHLTKSLTAGGPSGGQRDWRQRHRTIPYIDRSPDQGPSRTGKDRRLSRSLSPSFLLTFQPDKVRTFDRWKMEPDPPSRLAGTDVDPTPCLVFSFVSPRKNPSHRATPLHPPSPRVELHLPVDL